MEINGTPPHLITLFIIPSKALPFLVINEGGKRMEDFDWKIEQTLYLTIFGAEFGAAAAEYGPTINFLKKLQYFDKFHKHLLLS